MIKHCCTVFLALLTSMLIFGSESKKQLQQLLPVQIGTYVFEYNLPNNGMGVVGLYRDPATKGALIFTDFGDGHTVKKYEGSGGAFPSGTSVIYRGDKEKLSVMPNGLRRSVVIFGGAGLVRGSLRKTLFDRQKSE